MNAIPYQTFVKICKNNQILECIDKLEMSFFSPQVTYFKVLLLLTNSCVINVTLSYTNPVDNVCSLFITAGLDLRGFIKRGHTHVWSQLLQHKKLISNVLVITLSTRQ